MNRGLAIYVPTYNRPEIIEELLYQYMDIYMRMEIDIYIFDSSTNYQTENVVKEYMNKYVGLYYEKISSIIHSNKKVYDIYKKVALEKKYEYVWLYSDHTRWSESLIRIVQTKIMKKYDLIVVDTIDAENLGDKEYIDYNDFFFDCAWRMTLYGATVVRVDTILENVPWNYLVNTYLVHDRINHSHVALYFEQVIRIKSFRALHLSIKPKIAYTLGESHLSVVSGWRNEMFDVWTQYWESTIQALPECYKRKKEVIKKHGVCSGLFSDEGFQKARIENILNFKEYSKRIGIWNRYTNVEEYKILLLSIIPREFLYKLLQTEKKYIENRLKRNIKYFCGKYEKIYIYGCGAKSEEYFQYLNELSIRIKGYIVSSFENDKHIFHGYPVTLLNNAIIKDKKIGIIMALNQKNYREVMKNEALIKIEKRIFSEFSVK